MSQQKLEAGKHLAQIVDCGFKKFASGAEMAFLTFATKEGARMTWLGSLKTEINPKSGKSPAQRTVDQLLALGFNNNWENFTTGIELQCFDNPGKYFELVVEEESWTDKTSGEVKSALKIKWINDPDKPHSKGIEKLEKSQAVSLVHSLNLKGLTAQAMAELKASQPSAPVEPVKKAVNDSDIPF